MYKIFKDKPFFISVMSPFPNKIAAGKAFPQIPLP